jgi:putative endonuclease
MLRIMRECTSYTYIVASRTRVLYIGVTTDLARRVLEHRSCEGDGFTARYKCTRLVWYERHSDPIAAITREKQLKGWSRAKKIALIEQENCTWADLSDRWGQSFR